VAKNESFFTYADKGETSVYKFRVGDDPQLFVWFEHNGGGSLYRTPAKGPWRADDPLEPAEQGTLDEMLQSRGTTKRQWIDDLLAQFGERIGWKYP
jgi:hypothetical protein